MWNKLLCFLLLCLGLMAGAAQAAADAAVTATLTATQTAFTDNFSVIAAAFVGIVVVVQLVKMSVNWFRRAAK